MHRSWTPLIQPLKTPLLVMVSDLNQGLQCHTVHMSSSEQFVGGPATRCLKTALLVGCSWSAATVLQ